jgi:hypothetical protein
MAWIHGVYEGDEATRAAERCAGQRRLFFRHALSSRVTLGVVQHRAQATA